MLLRVLLSTQYSNNLAQNKFLYLFSVFFWFQVMSLVLKTDAILCYSSSMPGQKFSHVLVDLFWFLLLYPVTRSWNVFDLQIRNPLCWGLYHGGRQSSVLGAPDYDGWDVHFKTIRNVFILVPVRCVLIVWTAHLEVSHLISITDLSETLILWNTGKIQVKCKKDLSVWFAGSCLKHFCLC